MNLVSVIVPIYKTERYLAECVNSIKCQTYANLEIILVDDGSPDYCGKMCDEWALKDKRIKVIHKKNGGLSDARNAGIDIASGDWLMFVDSDDYLESEMVQKLLDIAILENADMSVCNVCYYFDDSLEKRIAPWQGVMHGTISGRTILKKVQYNAMIDTVYVVAWNKIYARKLFDNIRYPFGMIHEDEAVAHHILNQCDRIASVEEPLYNYRQVKESIMNQNYNIKRLDIIPILSERIRFYKKIGLGAYTAKMEDYYFWMIHDKYYLFKDNRENHLQLLKCRKATLKILLFYFRRSDVSIKAKMLEIIFCCFPSLYKIIIRLI